MLVFQFFQPLPIKPNQRGPGINKSRICLKNYRCTTIKLFIKYRYFLLVLFNFKIKFQPSQVGNFLKTNLWYFFPCGFKLSMTRFPPKSLHCCWQKLKFPLSLNLNSYSALKNVFILLRIAL